MTERDDGESVKLPETQGEPGGKKAEQFQTQAQKGKPGEAGHSGSVGGSQTDATRGGGNEGSSGAGGS
ncbi:MAG TPA: hypothetical protein VEH84_06655 [Alphaproteobacteria bacterium]|nr:hypothetical protein [Alphaproteobacteria bacterium]